MSNLTNKETLQRRFAAFKRFNEWEKGHPCSFEAGEALAAISSIYNLIPQEFRKTSPDLCGIKAMQSAFSHIRGHR